MLVYLGFHALWKYLFCSQPSLDPVDYVRKQLSMSSSSKPLPLPREQSQTHMLS